MLKTSMKLKRVVSVSLGSSERNHEAKVSFLGQDFLLQRFGTNGDLEIAAQMLRDYDGIADAFGLGGVDIYLRTKRNHYTLRDGLRLASIPKKTPVVDGSGLKDSLEPVIIRRLVQANMINIAYNKVLLVSAMDRSGMHEAFLESGCKVICGDLMFALNIPLPIYSQSTLSWIAFFLMPIVSRLPHHMLYPVGTDQDLTPNPKYTKFYGQADIIAGDFHYIRKSMPERMDGKSIITNTTTQKNVQELKERGVKWLVTTTPNYGGRSFGTNVLEAVFITLLQKRWKDITSKDYLDLIEKLDLQPRIEQLN